MRVLNRTETTLVGGGRRQKRYVTELNFGSKKVKTDDVMMQIERMKTSARR